MRCYNAYHKDATILSAVQVIYYCKSHIVQFNMLNKHMHTYLNLQYLQVELNRNNFFVSDNKRVFSKLAFPFFKVEILLVL